MVGGLCWALTPTPSATGICSRGAPTSATGVVSLSLSWGRAPRARDLARQADPLHPALSPGPGADYKGRYKPVTTSYDYDAPLSEAGDPTVKLFAIREVIAKVLSRWLVPAPFLCPQDFAAWSQGSESADGGLQHPGPGEGEAPTSLGLSLGGLEPWPST